MCGISTSVGGGWRTYEHARVTFLGAFAKLRKATISFVISVPPSVRMEQLGSHWTDFREILYLNIFRKSVAKIQVSLTLRRLMSYIYGAPILDVSRSHDDAAQSVGLLWTSDQLVAETST